MHVALITDGIWPYVLGGMQKHSYFLCKYLAKNKIYVDVIHFNQSSFDIDKLEFFTKEEKQFINSIIVDFPTGLKFPGHYIYKSYEHSKRIAKLLNDLNKQYDFIYTKGLTGWYLIKHKQQTRFIDTPVGVKFHGYEMFQKAPDLLTFLQHLFLLRYPVKSITQRADIVFSYGGKITDIIHQLGVPLNKIVELPSGVEEISLANGIKASTDFRKFVFLGRYERRKGVEELNEAILKLLELNKDTSQFQFHFIGPIPINKRISHKSIIYHGEIRDRAALQKIMRDNDVLLCPSWSEGLPNVILEAMSLGLSVIATDVGATRVLVSENTGWLLNSNKPSLLVSTIIEAIECSNSTLDKKKELALDKVKQNFNWDILIKKLIVEFEKHSSKLIKQ